jgi:hypothetical protein
MVVFGTAAVLVMRCGEGVGVGVSGCVCVWEREGDGGREGGRRREGGV